MSGLPTLLQANGVTRARHQRAWAAFLEGDEADPGAFMRKPGEVGQPLGAEWDRVYKLTPDELEQFIKAWPPERKWPPGWTADGQDWRERIAGDQVLDEGKIPPGHFFAMLAKWANQLVPEHRLRLIGPLWTRASELKLRNRPGQEAIKVLESHLKTMIYSGYPTLALWPALGGESEISAHVMYQMAPGMTVYSTDAWKLRGAIARRLGEAGHKDEKPGLVKESLIAARKEEALRLFATDIEKAQKVTMAALWRRLGYPRGMLQASQEYWLILGDNVSGALRFGESEVLDRIEVGKDGVTTQVSLAMAANFERRYPNEPWGVALAWMRAQHKAGRPYIIFANTRDREPPTLPEYRELYAACPELATPETPLYTEEKT